MKVYETSCQNCLLSKDSIVSPQRRKEILSEITQTQSYFICHKSSMNGEGKESEICCRKFYDSLGHVSQMVRIAERLNVVDFVPQPDSHKLPSWDEMNRGK